MALTAAQILYYYYSGGGGAAPLVLGSVVEFSGAVTEIASIGNRHLWNSRGWWHDGRTYFSLQGNINIENGVGSTYIIVYDENDGVRRPYRVAGPAGVTPQGIPGAGDPDTHSVPIVRVNDNGVYVFRETPHDTPIDIIKGSDFNDFVTLAEKINPGTGALAESSYHHIVKLPDGNYFSWCRMTKLSLAYSGGHAAWVRSTDGLEGWGALQRVSTNPRPRTSATVTEDQTRDYPFIPMYRQWYTDSEGTYLVAVRVIRTDPSGGTATGGQYNLYAIMRTKWVGADGGDDFGYVWENLVGDLYTHDIRDENYITEDIYRDEFAFFDVGGDYNTRNAFIPVVSLGTDGTVYVIMGDGESSDLYLRIIKNRTVTSKTLNILDYVKNDPLTSQGHTVPHLAHLNGYLEINILIDEGEEEVIHLFHSTDEGDTWVDKGTMEGSMFPDNYLDIPNNRNFALLRGFNDGLVSGSQGIRIQRAAKGIIQTEGPRIVVPITNYSDAFDLFDYHGDGSALTKTGNNVTALIDQFGLRNAVGTNNPQWDGSDAVTFNGTNNYFTIPTAGLTALTKVTFCVVVRGSADSMGILFFSDNTQSADFIAFLLRSQVVSAPAFQFQENQALIQYGQDDLKDNEWHLLTFVVDGRCKADIYVDGKKQFYGNNANFDTLAEYLQRGMLNFGTVNSIRIASRDGSGTDGFSAFSMRQLMMKQKVYSYDDQRGIERRIADLRGITLNYGYE